MLIYICIYLYINLSIYINIYNCTYMYIILYNHLKKCTYIYIYVNLQLSDFLFCHKTDACQYRCTISLERTSFFCQVLPCTYKYKIIYVHLSFYSKPYCKCYFWLNCSKEVAFHSFFVKKISGLFSGFFLEEKCSQFSYSSLKVYIYYQKLNHSL